MAEKVSSELAGKGKTLGLEKETNYNDNFSHKNEDILNAVVCYSTVNSTFAVFRNMCNARFSFAFWSIFERTSQVRRHTAKQAVWHPCM
jgi:hypothetical protein